MPNHTPTAQGHSQTAAPGTVIPLTTLFTYSDADGLGDIVYFDVRDQTSGGGHLVHNGVTWPDGSLTPDQPISTISQWSYVVGSNGSVDTIGFNVTDSQGAFNPTVTATVTAQATNHDPTATGHDQTVAAGTSIALSTLFSYSDPDSGDSVSGFAVQDVSAGGGHLYLNGVQQADNVVYGNTLTGLPISQLSQWTYVAGPSGSTDTIHFTAVDTHNAFNHTPASATVTVPAGGDTVPDTPATATTFLTLEQWKPGKIDSTGQDGLAGDNDVYKVTLTAGHTYTFSANVNGIAGDTLDQAFIRIYDTNGNKFSPDLTAGGTGTPHFTTPIISTSGTYYFAISADGAGTTWKSKTGDYSILVHDNGAPQPTTIGPLNSTQIQTGTTASEVVNIALANRGVPWAADGCAAFVWGVTNLAGIPFFDLSDKTSNHNPLTPADVAYVVPHSAGHYSGTSDIAGDGWYLVSSTTSASQLASILQPGDVVRVYKAGNTNEDSGTTTALAHSFIVVSNSGGNVQVVDNWTGSTISQHAFSDIANSWAPGGNFAAAYVSRIDPNWAAAHIDQSTVQGNGFGDWSSLGVAQPPAYFISASPNPVNENTARLHLQ